KGFNYRLICISANGVRAWRCAAIPTLGFALCLLNFGQYIRFQAALFVPIFVFGSEKCRLLWLYKKPPFSIYQTAVFIMRYD
ncbi:hypothetical protein QG085_09540, partial [Kingella kingae]|uniref:hypothetical protein n=1 Tax=Kingella kingae TaxID=504 RepID=UPI00254A79CA